jgi:DNA-binding response OmpR family regulator
LPQQKVIELLVLISVSSSHMRQHTSLNATEGQPMPLDLFSRKLVLLVEDEPLIAHDIEHHLRKAGARVITAGYLEAGLYMAEHPDLSGAVIDIRLGKHNAISICRRLAHRNIPFVVHTGYSADRVRREWPTTPIIHKPATPEQITHALSRSISVARQFGSDAIPKHYEHRCADACSRP